MGPREDPPLWTKRRRGVQSYLPRRWATGEFPTDDHQTEGSRIRVRDGPSRRVRRPRRRMDKPREIKGYHTQWSQEGARDRGIDRLWAGLAGHRSLRVESGDTRRLLRAPLRRGPDGYAGL